MIYGANYTQQPTYYTPQLYSNPLQLAQPQQTVTSQNLRDPIAVDGIDGAYQCQLPSDVRSTIAYDVKEKMMYLIIVDGLRRTVKVYDYKDHEESKPESETKDDLQESLKEIHESLDSINNRLSDLEGNNNGNKLNSSDTQQLSKPANSKYNKSGS